ncbi:hypothetical protein B0T25DRAFT_571113 [Lasiosphaeria hispida]|uniref:Uncharacterized protein n=1 Tax=Lasiosphaeria hispida TaxID=260671 RepID=A0AAJ0HAC9_9PEZI|nr:hypothetical protein B0T25DRAFT_571113 [Lasiosphaeria hispida]
MGNVLSSAGRFEDALKLQLKAEKTRKENIPKDMDDVKWTAVINQNIGRCHALVGQFDKAEHRLQLAKEFEGSKNWGILAYTMFALANIERRKNNAAAKEASYSYFFALSLAP